MSPGGLAGDPGGPGAVGVPLPGVLYGPCGCLATTILRLCRSGQVARPNVRIEPLPGIRDAWPPWSPSPAGRAWDQRRLTRLASNPFRPEQSWLWRQRPPPWNDWCQQVSPWPLQARIPEVEAS